MTDADGEVRELTETDFEYGLPFSALPASLQNTLRGLETAKLTKVSTTVRFDREVIETFRATGKGWQTRMNDALKDWLKEHPVIG